MAETKALAKDAEREYIVPLRFKWAKVPRYKRANKAVKAIKEFLVRHMKVRDRDLNKIKIDKYLNEFIWARGIKKPPAKIKIKVVREGELIRTELADIPDKLKFKKAKLDRRKERAVETSSKKTAVKPEEKPAETTEEKAEEKKEAEEKKSAVVEAGQEQAKMAAKTAKHQTKISKQPKHQQRKALKK